MNRHSALLIALTALPMVVLAPATGRCVGADDLTQVFSDEKPIEDPRLQPPREIYNEYHPWTPPTSLDAWQQTANQIREQILVASGLWPLPEKTPLTPVIHGTIDRGDYTVEKVYFASLPGHYVSGNLYRPKNVDGPTPGVLCPHGHWKDGRFYDAGDGAQAQLDSGAESFDAGAHFPLQARCVQLARMGCIVFHYDMQGYADSQPLDHRQGMDDVRSLLWQNNKLGLQTWNSIRALDFLETLPGIDSSRLAVTGASGGGTQTMLLAAVDDRVSVSFPAVMVSTGMQGGCICENASYLRIGINNVAIAAAFAPKPQRMSGADDWTIAIETKGLPELKQVYSLYGQGDLVDARALPQFKHNYNQHSRELMYDWFNQHLDLGWPSPVKEQDFEPVPPSELTVFDAGHPRPADAMKDPELQQQMIAASRRQYQELIEQGKSDLKAYQQVIGTAARVMLGEFPDAGSITTETTDTSRIAGVQLRKGWSKRETGRVTPWLALVPDDADGRTVLWVHGEGKSHLLKDGQPTAAVRKLLDQGMAIASIDTFATGEFPENSLAARMERRSTNYPGFVFCYNPPLLAERVGDIAAAIASLSAHQDVKKIHLIGTGGAGPAVLLARAITPANLVDRTLVDLEGASFSTVSDPADPLLLPAALKYGGLGGLAALALPARLSIYGVDESHRDELDPLEILAKDKERVATSTESLSESDLTSQLGR